MCHNKTKRPAHLSIVRGLAGFSESKGTALSWNNQFFYVESSYTSDSNLEEKELFELIDKLPSGYRNVFRMAVIDGFSHKEIAEKLGIEPHSSSSQLTRAKVL